MNKVEDHCAKNITVQYCTYASEEESFRGSFGTRGSEGKELTRLVQYPRTAQVRPIVCRSAQGDPQNNMRPNTSIPR